MPGGQLSQRGDRNVDPLVGDQARHRQNPTAIRRDTVSAPDGDGVGAGTEPAGIAPETHNPDPARFQHPKFAEHLACKRGRPATVRHQPPGPTEEPPGDGPFDRRAPEPVPEAEQVAPMENDAVGHPCHAVEPPAQISGWTDVAAPDEFDVAGRDEHPGPPGPPPQPGQGPEPAGRNANPIHDQTSIVGVRHRSGRDHQRGRATRVPLRDLRHPPGDPAPDRRKIIGEQEIGHWESASIRSSRMANRSAAASMVHPAMPRGSAGPRSIAVRIATTSELSSSSPK